MNSCGASSHEVFKAHACGNSPQSGNTNNTRIIPPLKPHVIVKDWNNLFFFEKDFFLKFLLTEDILLTNRYTYFQFSFFFVRLDFLHRCLMTTAEYQHTNVFICYKFFFERLTVKYFPSNCHFQSKCLQSPCSRN